MTKISFGEIDIAVEKINQYQPHDDHEIYIKSFIINWLDGKHFFEFSTSGSTGKPKLISIARNDLIKSAQATIQYLGLKKGGNALLCMNPRFIGGTMMLVRALVNDMDIKYMTPSNRPLINLTSHISLAAMVPLQLTHAINHDKEALELIDHLIVGGGAIDTELDDVLATLDVNIYASYGMTETVSHIALRKVNGSTSSNYFNVLPGIKIEIDSRGCLIIHQFGKTIITNDRVELKVPNKFIWLGREDNVINSGGIKIHPEQLEKDIQTIFNRHGLRNKFFVHGIPDNILGNKAVIIMEKPVITIDFKKLLKNHISKYHVPKALYFVDKFKYTASGKLNRKATVNTIH